MPKCCDSIFVTACRILAQSENPVIPSGRMRVEAKSVPNIFHSLGRPPLECLQLTPERPSVGLVWVNSKRYGQFRGSLFRPAVIDQHIPENRMRLSIVRVEGYGTLGRCKGARGMVVRGFQPVRPCEMVAHREPSVGLPESGVEFDRFLKVRRSVSIAIGRLRHHRPSTHE